MLITVNRVLCEGHGLCEQIAPDVYQLDDEGELLILASDGSDPALVAAAEAGARVCPVAALAVER